MTSSGDNDPVAPRRSLGGPATASRPASGSGSSAPAAATPGSSTAEPQTETQPAIRPPYASATPRTYTVADAETGMPMPVPPAPEQNAPPVHTPASPARERAAARAVRRANSRRPRQTRRAKLRLTRIDPWSVTKTAFLLSIAFGIMCVVAVFLVFSIMSAAGLWDHINSTIQGLINEKPGHQFDIKQYVGMSRVMGITMLIAAVDVVLITALATLSAFIYNLSSAVLGGVEVTLAEDLK
ncbi:MAG: DUF3566 domain-containing protein [Nocardioidaceae bacterium]